MAGFTKLFSSIVTSSIWMEDDRVLRVWIAMLSQCDGVGRVEGSVPGFAHLCRIEVDEMERILTILQSPDPYSRTKVNEGRRILPIPGGWQIINYLSYREKGQAKDGSRAPYMRAYRSKHPVTKCNALPLHITRNTEVEVEAEANNSTPLPPSGERSKEKGKRRLREVKPKEPSLAEILGGKGSDDWNNYWLFASCWPKAKNANARSLAEAWMEACKKDEDIKIYEAALEYQKDFLPPKHKQDDSQFMKSPLTWLKEEAWLNAINHQGGD